MDEARDSLAAVRGEIIECRRCPRLVEFRERVARVRKREFERDVYWGRPVPGFGDPLARLVVVGLAPAAHGANRTGRVFTGDRSAAFLVRALFEAGFANQPTSRSRGDGLRYRDLYLTAAVRCVPPDNRPRPDERDRCAPFLERELRLLTEARAYLALGAFAWEAVRDAAARTFRVEVPRAPFAHGRCVPLGPGRPLLWASYHPSPQNTNTGRQTLAMLVDLLARIRAGWELSTAGPEGRRRPAGSGPPRPAAAPQA
ncbi:MAG TPA: uracil-DNA glycosylase [Thermoplasmata archaeon]|nr:uracil-DNA glycosylase [Thermoplasmata archaeon]